MLAKPLLISLCLVSTLAHAGLDSRSPIFTFGGENFYDTIEHEIAYFGDDPYVLVLDKNRNTYVGGETGGENINFSANGSNPNMVLTNTTLHPYYKAYESDGFLTKFNAGGVAQWTFLVEGEEDVAVRAAATDRDNNVYIIAEVRKDIAFSRLNQDGTKTLLHEQTYALSRQASAVIKLSPLGNIIWVKNIWAKLQNDSNNDLDSEIDPNTVTVDDSGLYIAGNFEGEVYFNPDDKSVVGKREDGDTSDEAFILKMNFDGQYLWSRYIGSDQTDTIIDIEADNGFIYSVSKHKSTEDGTSFDGAYQTISHASEPSYEVTGSKEDEDFCAIQKFDAATGETIWTQTVETGPSVEQLGGDCAPSMIAVGDSLVSINGSYDGILDFDPSEAKVATSVSNANHNSFILAINKNNGLKEWYATFNHPAADDGSTNWSQVYSHDLAAFGDSIYFGFSLRNRGGETDRLQVTGDAKNVQTWANEIVTTYSPSPTTLIQDIAIVKLDKEGDAKWIQQWNGDLSYKIVRAFATSTTGEVIMSGQFTGSMDIDPTPRTNNVETIDYKLHNSTNGRDAFVVRLNADGSYDESVPVNNAPVIVHAEETLPLNSPDVTLDLLAHASDVDGDEIFIDTAVAEHGSISIVDGVVTYTPLADFEGEDIITYTVYDSNGESTTGTLKLIISSNVSSETIISGGSTGLFSLTLLGLCGLFRNKKKVLPKAILSLFLAVSLPSHAKNGLDNTTDHGWYANANLGLATTHDLDNVGTAISNSYGSASNIDIDDNGVSGSLYLGYQVTNHFAVEFGYWNLGSREVSFEQNSSDSDSYLDQAQFGYVSSGHGAHLNLIGKTALTDKWQVAAKLGYLQWQADYDTKVAGEKLKRTQTQGGDLTLGLGLGYQVLSNVELHLDYNYVSLKGSEITEVAFGTRYHF
ncbi:hypothetical protein AHAT_04890 [Agarivorans sp. Toyoura001]|uniref:Ig-like domain-containing protein n=1 Tax=Agarivorans sp. Toyoura001 TaxID=2283141 RepID=UPI0010F32806|nr:cadherin-like domain-containing protein [Agarivorans sp. Toyoura001]GDY24599.1 hypothetical protein AHAT_04890 [Agarivorans sp. Toyoura001]